MKNTLLKLMNFCITSAIWEQSITSANLGNRLSLGLFLWLQHQQHLTWPGANRHLPAGVSQQLFLSKLNYGWFWIDKMFLHTRIILFFFQLKVNKYRKTTPVKFDELPNHKRQGFSKFPKNPVSQTPIFKRKNVSLGKFHWNLRQEVVLDQYFKFQAVTPSCAVANQFLVSPERLAKWCLWYFGQRVTIWAKCGLIRAEGQNRHFWNNSFIFKWSIGRSNFNGCKKFFARATMPKNLSKLGPNE